MKLDLHKSLTLLEYDTLYLFGNQETHSCGDQRTTAERMINSYWELSQKTINFSISQNKQIQSGLVLYCDSALRPAKTVVSIIPGVDLRVY